MDQCFRGERLRIGIEDDDGTAHFRRRIKRLRLQRQEDACRGVEADKEGQITVGLVAGSGRSVRWAARPVSRSAHPRPGRARRRRHRAPVRPPRRCAPPRRGCGESAGPTFSSDGSLEDERQC
jgi:hypothetical protein